MLLKIYNLFISIFQSHILSSFKIDTFFIIVVKRLINDL